MTTQAQVRDNPNYTPVFDHGFVGLIDVMGSDGAIEQAARLSYGGDERPTTELRSLLRYMMRHRHCYHPKMQVLTIRGWIEWESCRKEETFIVPDPITHTYKFERLSVLRFTTNEELHTFSNDRMCYKVTPGHMMWFQGKYKTDFDKILVDDMLHWGWFEPITEYNSLKSFHDVFIHHPAPDEEFRFLGFYLGDGSYASTNRITFHLKKQRKINYLFYMIRTLNLEYTSKPSSTYPNDGIIVMITTPDFLRHWIEITARSKNKAFPLDCLEELSVAQKLGLLEGLISSNGSIRRDRPQIQFASSSLNLINLFQALMPFFGFDAHRVSVNSQVYVSTAYSSSRTTLECRKEHFGREPYNGDVFCTTTSTGLLVVRGSDDTFGFVCGNSSPFEMAELKFHIRLPIFVMRQLVRHRTSSMNEWSGRYTEMPEEFYLPETEVIQPQSQTNKQGRAGSLDLSYRHSTRRLLSRASNLCFHVYQILLGYKNVSDPALPFETIMDAEFRGISREVARICLPLSAYTEIIWKQNLHNLFHLFKLRLDPHAQFEIRQFAQAMYDFVKPRFPLACEAFEDYIRQAYTLSHMEQRLLCDFISSGLNWSQFFSQQNDPCSNVVHGRSPIDQLALKYDMSKREVKDFLEMIGECE